jgi:ribosomal protein S18 acetylase RimI-like enzyme
MEVLIITPCQSDAPTLGKIESRCFPPAEAASSEKIAERMAAFPENFLAATVDKEIVGFIDGATTGAPQLPDELYSDTSLHDPKGAYQTVFGLSVLPEYRRKGIAEKLLKEFISIARSRGKSGMVLTCKKHLIHYYEKFGFSCLGLSKSVHGGALWYDMRIDF